jgi:hypothetical protein
MNLTLFSLDEALPAEQLAEIRLYLQQQRALGRDAFKAMLEAKTPGASPLPAPPIVHAAGQEKHRINYTWPRSSPNRATNWHIDIAAPH